MRREHVQDYITLSDCYDLLNKELFNSKLRGCQLTFEKKGQVAGYYREEGFISNDGETKRDEISLNPDGFVTENGDLEILQTLLHEMVHQWQTQFGNPSQRTYHNQEWADKMEELGLIPSSTGKPGGKRTGQSMADYPATGGRFLKIAEPFLSKKRLIRFYNHDSLVKRVKQGGGETKTEELKEVLQIITEALGEPQESETSNPTPSKPPSKIGYVCPTCGAKAWGKPNLILLCGQCRTPEKLATFVSVKEYS